MVTSFQPGEPTSLKKKLACIGYITMMLIIKGRFGFWSIIKIGALYPYLLIFGTNVETIKNSLTLLPHARKGTNGEQIKTMLITTLCNSCKIILQLLHCTWYIVTETWQTTSGFPVFFIIFLLRQVGLCECMRKQFSQKNECSAIVFIFIFIFKIPFSCFMVMIKISPVVQKPIFDSIPLQTKKQPFQ